MVKIDYRFCQSVQILPGHQKPYYLASNGLEKGAYVRIGSTNRQADLSAIEELKRQARGVSYLDENILSRGQISPE